MKDCFPLSQAVVIVPGADLETAMLPQLPEHRTRVGVR